MAGYFGLLERAREFSRQAVVVPIEERGLEGIERVWALCDSWLDFVEQGILPGGYFFTGVAGLLGGIKYLFDMAEKNRHPEC